MEAVFTWYTCIEFKSFSLRALTFVLCSRLYKLNNGVNRLFHLADWCTVNAKKFQISFLINS